MKASLIATLFFICSSVMLLGQEDENKNACPPVENKKAIALYEKALDKKKYKVKAERLDFLKKAIELEPDYAEAHLKYSMEILVYSKLNNSTFAPAIPSFKKAVEICPQIHSEPYYYIGFYYYEEMKNDSAIYWLDKFVKFKDDDENKFSKTDYEVEMSQAKEMIKQAKKEIALNKKVVPFNPSVVKGVSTERSEYLPYISPDETAFYYCRTMPDDNEHKVAWTTDKEKEVFMLSLKGKDGQFDSGTPLPDPFNKASNEGGATVTIDNKYLYYARTMNEGGAQPNTDIYYTTNIGGSWDDIKKLPGVNDPIYWDSQPTVSANGTMIIFASNRPGGYGKLDLYATIKDPVTKKWGAPKNLGPTINTSENEKTPFLHSDSETLYFSSDGLFGFGQGDIFYSRKDEKGNWSKPENIGAPINGAEDDAGFFVSTNGKLGYFCSYSNEGKVSGLGIGKYDLFQFDLYKEARPDSVVFIKGEIKKENNEPLTNFTVEIKNMKTHEKTIANVDSVTGEYMAAINLKKSGKEDLMITANAEDHAFTAELVKMKDDVSFEKPPVVDPMEIKKAEKGKSFVINHIYYATGAADLYPQSFPILDEFAEFLINHPNMKVEIQGHTDNVGGAAENIKLSQERANNTMKYLIEKGVSTDNISAKGYGPNKPIADNKTIEGKAKNRRTEFMIVDK